jgi:1-acyl-sn-glycerol-3-phosphate acyltransferase
MRSALTLLTLLLATPVAATTVIVAALLGVRDREGAVFDKALRWWAKSLIWAAGVKVVVHGAENQRGAQHIFVANHVSWCDVPALATIITRFKFVAKAELGRVPLFGAAMRAIGSVYVDRANRTSSIESLREAAAKIRDGASVVIFPEGTRGTEYPLRQFKKGAFVLAIDAQVPVVPVVIHGSIEVLPRGSFWVRAGRVNVHFLEPVPSTGLVYEDRNVLAARVRDRMAAKLEQTYGIKSAARGPKGSGSLSAPR